MIEPGPNDRIYSANQIAPVVGALRDAGVAFAQALESTGLSERDLLSPATRVSQNQVIQCCRNALRLSTDPFFAYKVGMRFHISTFGILGFALLSSADFRQGMQIAIKYHILGTPLTNISFREESDRAVYTIVPIRRPSIDPALYRFIVECNFGIHNSLQNDVRGSLFSPLELHVTYRPANETQAYRTTFGCPVHFEQLENSIVYDRKLLDGGPQFGNEITNKELVRLCDQLLRELRVRIGTAGKVREALLHNLARPVTFEGLAHRLQVTTRTLRRKLRDEGTSFRKLADELRMEVAIKYLQDTDLTVSEIANAIGFSDTANFRHAFRRWTKAAPHEFRGQAAFQQ